VTTPTARTDAPRSAPRLSLVLGSGAFVAVLLTLADPGITIDEPLDVRVGHDYAITLRLWAAGKWSPFRRPDVDRAFAGSAQHPPLGRVLVGESSRAFGPFAALFGLADTYGVYAGRVAPAAAFGLLVGLVAGFTARRAGRAAGVGAAVALVFMPRLFAHAHFATLDTILNLFWVGTVLAAAGAVEARRPVWALAAAGVLWGLALLTKIHAWLLPPLLLGWTLARLGWRRGTAGWLAWCVVGLAILFVGWPWLWHDPVGRLRAFLGTSVERLALRVEYFGRVYLDRDVPWHYPWLYFAVTVPVGLHLLGVVGLIDAWRGRQRDASPVLLIGAMLLLLAVFSTRAPVYDGERLFLPVFPLWAVFVGRGFAVLWRAAGGVSFPPFPRERERAKVQAPGEGRAERQPPISPHSAPPRGPLPLGEGETASRPGSRVLRAGLVLFVVAQGWGLVRMHPFQLSYYNALIGGLPGAARLGMELTYWGDAVDRRLLDALAARIRPGQTAALVPTLHHIQPVATTTPALARRGVVLQDQAAAGRADWLVVYRRTAYWPEGLARRLDGRRPRLSNTRQGVWLAAFWDMPKPRTDPAGKTAGPD
jgi:4-amino-4-deoxy-L-arabinose transferase-like glycosyltransferase